MDLDNIEDSVVLVHRLFVGEIELDGDAKVAAGDDDRRYDQVEGEHGDDKGREALMFHLSPGKRTGQAKGLWPVPSPAQNGKQSPDQSVQPDPHAQQLCFLPADFLTCKDKMMKALLWKNKNYIPDFPKTKCRLQGRIKVSMPK